MIPRDDYRFVTLTASGTVAFDFSANPEEHIHVDVQGDGTLDLTAMPRTADVRMFLKGSTVGVDIDITSVVAIGTDDFQRYDTTNDSDWEFRNETAAEIALSGRGMYIAKLTPDNPITSSTDVSAAVLRFYAKQSSGSATLTARAALTVGSSFLQSATTATGTVVITGDTYTLYEIDISSVLTELKSDAGGSNITSFYVQISTSTSGGSITAFEHALGGAEAFIPGDTLTPFDLSWTLGSIALDAESGLPSQVTPGETVEVSLRLDHEDANNDGSTVKRLYAYRVRHDPAHEISKLDWEDNFQELSIGASGTIDLTEQTVAEVTLTDAAPSITLPDISKGFRGEVELFHDGVVGSDITYQFLNSAAAAVTVLGDDTLVVASGERVIYAVRYRAANNPELVFVYRGAA